MIRSWGWTNAAILAAFLVGCGDGDDGTGPELPTPTQVTLEFTVGSSPALVSGAQAAPSMSFAQAALTISGHNGTLTISDVRMILAEFELEKVSGSCTLGEGMECHDFEAAPSFLQLPLDGGIVTVAISEVPLGSYDELEFEVEDLEDDPDDDNFAEIEALRDLVLGEFADWPDKASMLVIGRFVPTVGESTDFRVYFDAEIEIELDLVPSLVVSEEGASWTLTVDVQPGLWFMLPGGDVLDLSQHDWDVTGELLDFEFELEDGFAEIEIG